MEKKILLANGPNLNLLGSREPEIYGITTLQELEEQIISFFQTKDIKCLAFQSNIEGALIDWLQSHKDAQFLIFNPAAWTHTSIALRDTILSIGLPFLEIHISNVYRRESFRHQSYFSDIAIGSLVGMGVYGYIMAANFALEYLHQVKP